MQRDSRRCRGPQSIAKWNTFRAILNFATKYGLQNPIGRKAVQSLKVDDAKLVYFTPEEWRKFITAFDDAAAWRAHVKNIRNLGPVKIGAAAGEPRRFGAGRKPDSEATNEYLERLRTFPPIFNRAAVHRRTTQRRRHADMGSGSTSIDRR